MSDRKTEFTSKMARLHSSFEDNLGERIEAISSIVSGLKTQSAKEDIRESLENLYVLTHKLAGAAGTFGYASISDVARLLEKSSIDALRSAGRKGKKNSENMEQIHVQFETLRAATAGAGNGLNIDGATWQIVLEKIASGNSSVKKVILVDDDETMARVLIEQLLHFGFDIRWIGDTKDLKAAILKDPPAAVLMDIVFPNDNDAGIREIASLKGEGLLTCPVIYISIRGDAEARLGAVRTGCAGFLVKPVDIIELSDTLRRVTFEPGEARYRVLIIDDDEDVAKYHALLLGQVGMETKAVTEPLKAVSAVRELQPDVILMDINMPGCSGFELASVIRQINEFVQIPIIFLTAQGGLEQEFMALRSGADEFLDKTVDSGFLVATVTARAQRARHLNTIVNRLRESETRFRAVSQTAVDAIVSVDQEGRIIFWNAAAETIFGYKPAEILGREFVDILSEESRRSANISFQGEIAAIDQSMVGNTVELEGLKNDGGSVPVEVSLSEWKIGERKFMSAIIRDISDRKRAEQELRRFNAELESRVADRTAELQESEQRLAEILNVSDEAIVSIGEDGRISLFNKGAERIFGYDAEEVMGRELDMLLPEQIKGAHHKHVAGFAKSDVEARRMAERAEISGMRKDGTEFAAEASISSVKLKGGMVLTAFLRDISDRKKIEQAVRMSEEQVRLLLDSTGEAIYGVDTRGLCTFINQACLRLLGYETAEQCLGKNMHELMHHSRNDGSPYPANECKIYQAFIRRESAHVEDEVLWRKDGSSFEAEYWSNPIAREGEIVGAVVNFVDLTDRKMIERELRQAQKMEVVGQLTGGVAHDFNNILQIISGYSHVAKTRVKDDPVTSGHLDKVLHAANRAASLTQQLLAFSRQQVHNPQSVNINALVTRLVEMLGRVFPETIEIQSSFGGDLDILNADPATLEQVLLNLCLNSRDAMPNGGQLTIATESFSASKSFCRSHSWAKPGRYALISVSDTGEGMSQEVREKIFEPFFTTKEVGKGSGLGLSMAYGTIQQHDGEILVSSEIGIGTTFKIFLPSWAEVEAVSEQSEDVEISGGNETILVAEDEEAVLFLTSALLEHKGYTVVTAKNGVEALEIIESNNTIDLVLLDVVMPKMGGREVFEKIKKIRPSIPVLFSTGYADNAIDREFLTKNGVSLINKPFAPEDLYFSVRHSLDSP